ncbi:Mediator of RNA polymerase II transcription subunit 10 [Spathaspora sp. JA1]|nr:Mediator of RNA polymerase II transcription subunit 10 [Spathaspora sp. JA1]
MTTAQLDPDKPGNEALISTADQLSALIESLIELGVLVHDNQGTLQSHTASTHKVNQIISQLSGLTTNPYTNQYPVPIDVISYIEDGRNPDIYTREFIEVTAKSNARLKGKMQGFAKLRDVLGDKLGKEFPALIDSIEDIKKRTTPNDNDE